MNVERIALVAALLLVAGCLAITLCLVLARLVKDHAERRRQHVRSSVWRVVLTLGSGEDEEIDEAYAVLLNATPAQRRAVESGAFALLPKLRGDSRQRLSEVLLAWGALGRATHSTTSRSAVRRCRGYYRLGVLAEPGRRDELLRGLDDRDFIARRTAMLALGSFPDPRVVEKMLDAAAAEPRLRGDFLAAIDRIGLVSAPGLRHQLTQALESRDEQDARRGRLAAEALGLVGATDSVEVLEAGLADTPDEFRIACIDALGSLGLPTSIIVLGDQLDHPNPDVRRASAQALGLIGAAHAVELLTAVLEDDNVEVARAAANALHRCGRPGQRVIRLSTIPVAREVQALTSLRAHS
ncbi:MAG: HEAT repeat domain-containing protein [Nocardioides sp.]